MTLFTVFQNVISPLPPPFLSHPHKPSTPCPFPRHFKIIWFRRCFPNNIYKIFQQHAYVNLWSKFPLPALKFPWGREGMGERILHWLTTPAWVRVAKVTTKIFKANNKRNEGKPQGIIPTKGENGIWSRKYTITKHDLSRLPAPDCHNNNNENNNNNNNNLGDLKEM